MKNVARQRAAVRIDKHQVCHMGSGCFTYHSKRVTFDHLVRMGTKATVEEVHIKKVTVQDRRFCSG